MTRVGWLLAAPLWVSCTSSRLPDPGTVTLKALDSDGSGTLTADELGDRGDAHLAEVDTNRSGDIDASELSAHLQRVPHSPLRMQAGQRGKERRMRPHPTPEETRQQAPPPQ